MKFSVFALDYDGTIAKDGQLDPEVRSAIREVRARGVAVVLVTGRILSDLSEVAEGIDFVDAVVAENGAILAFPGGNSRVVGQPPAPYFLEELSRRGIGFRAGQCVVETDAREAERVLDVIRGLEAPLVILFNRGRLMVLPQAVSKGTGLREALAMLRVSPHNAIAIGDAENDHDLLAACEFGVAVEWGSKALQVNADDVLPGDGPNAVAAYIRQAARNLRLPAERMDRNRPVLGTAEDGYALTLSVRGRNILIAGDPRSGKSWATGLTCEQLIFQGYTLCIIDAEGDYRTLESLPGVVVFGGDVPPPELPDLGRVLRHPGMSVVVDLSHVPYRDKVDYLNMLLPMLAALRRTSGMPHRIVVDEAHYFLHQPNVRELLDLDLGAYTLVTYRSSDLPPDLRKAIDVTIVNRTTDPRETQTLLDTAGTESVASEWKAIFAGLAMNEAVLLPGIAEAGGKLRRFQLSPRWTTHVRHRAKYVDLQLIENQGFVFTENGKPVATPARSLRDFVSSVKMLPLSILEGHARRGDFSQWIAAVFHDHRLASDIRKVEQRYRLGHARDLYNSLAECIQERYDLGSGIEELAQEPLVSIKD